ncbi:TolC family protein [Propionivibrio sp.]|uniref:TolC family protein n=1 Tax=Propionivibrio sp. TaxID=2212460 RepID=UPI003BF026A8
MINTATLVGYCRRHQSMAVAAFAAGLFIGSAASAFAQTVSGLSFNDAIHLTLHSNRDVQIGETQVQVAGAVVQQAQGVFDPLLAIEARRNEDRRPLNQAEQLLTPVLTDLSGSGSGFDAKVEKRLRSGQTLLGSATSTYLQNNTSRLLGLPSQTTRSIAFGLRVPLFRGAGESNAANANLKSVEQSFAAATAEKRFAVSLALRDAAIAYWEYSSRWRQLEISRSGEERTLGLLQELRKLVAADEVPAADIDLAQANHFERINTRISAEQALLEAQQSMGRSMGLTSQLQREIGQPLTPPPPPSGVSDLPGLKLLLERALLRRGDWQAIELRILALGERLTGARDLARPQIDLSLFVSSNSLQEGASLSGAANPLAGNSSGPSVAAILNFQLPVGNNAANGLVRQTSALLTEAEIRRESLRADIGAAVEASSAQVRRSAEAMRGSEQIVLRYAKTLDHERTRRRLGVATLIDVVNVEDRYFRALLDDVQRRSNYAASLARLGHDVDALVGTTGDQLEVNLASFMRFALP